MNIIYGTNAKMIIDGKEYPVQSFQYKPISKWYDVFANMFWKIKTRFQKHRFTGSFTIKL
jgi:hypothetical protein